MEDKTYKIGDRITFHIADGSKHYGRVEDIIPELGGGTSYPSGVTRSANI